MHINTIYDMYNGTTVGALATGIAGVIQKCAGDLSDEFYRNIYNLNTATGDALDAWGLLLRFPRYIDDGSNGVLRLDDAQYSTVLKIVYSTLTIEPTIPNLNHVMAVIFGLENNSVYVVDDLEMGFITYVFVTNLPAWMARVFYDYDILPRPMGVGVSIREEASQIFGFEGQATDDNNIGNLTQSIFYKEPDENAESPSGEGATLDEEEE